MTKLLLALVLYLVLLPVRSHAQALNPSGFTERHDTLIVYAAGVVLLTPTESAMGHAFDSAHTSADSAAIASAIFAYRQSIKSTLQQLEEQHIPNLTTACRYICIAGDRQMEVFDRRKLIGDDGLELYDAFVTDGRGVVQFLTDLQSGAPNAWGEINELLHR